MLEIYPGEDHVEQTVELNQQQSRVRWAVSQLPSEQAEALTLAYFSELTQQEIAARLRPTTRHCKNSGAPGDVEASHLIRRKRSMTAAHTFYEKNPVDEIIRIYC